MIQPPTSLPPIFQSKSQLNSSSHLPPSLSTPPLAAALLSSPLLWWWSRPLRGSYKARAGAAAAAAAAAPRAVTHHHHRLLPSPPHLWPRSKALPAAAWRAFKAPRARILIWPRPALLLLPPLHRRRRRRALCTDKWAYVLFLFSPLLCSALLLYYSGGRLCSLLCSRDPNCAPETVRVAQFQLRQRDPASSQLSAGSPGSPSCFTCSARHSVERTTGVPLGEGDPGCWPAESQGRGIRTFPEFGFGSLLFLSVLSAAGIGAPLCFATSACSFGLTSAMDFYVIA